MNLKRFKNCVLSPVVTDGAGWEHKESLALPPDPTESKVLTCLGQKVPVNFRDACGAMSRLWGLQSPRQAPLSTAECREVCLACVDLRQG